jgi:hypothetical protein
MPDDPKQGQFPAFRSSRRDEWDLDSGIDAAIFCLLVIGCFAAFAGTIGIAVAALAAGRAAGLW